MTDRGVIAGVRSAVIGAHLDYLDAIGSTVCRLVVDQGWSFGDRFERLLAQARIPGPGEVYVSRAIATGLLVGAASWVIAAVALFWVPRVVRLGPTGDPPMMAERALGALALASATAVLVTGVVLGMYLVRPALVASSRRREIDRLLPDVVAFMYGLSLGGFSQIEIIAAVASERDTYGAVAQEFESIRRETIYFDTDYRTAIREQAVTTPSDELSEFLTDLLSIVSTGGDVTAFLADEADAHRRTAKQQQKSTLDTVELFGEVYIALSLFPLLLIIVLVIVGAMGHGRPGLLFATIYGLIPIGSGGFLVLLSMVQGDEPGDGTISLDGRGVSEEQGEPVTAHRRAIDAHPAGTSLFDRIERQERLAGLRSRLVRPHEYFCEEPYTVFWVTVPVTIIMVAHAITSGIAPTTWAGLVRRPVVGTVVYLHLPVTLTVAPLAMIYGWNRRSRRPITGELTDTLRKLSSANATGLTLFESMASVAESSSGRLADELDTVCAKVERGMSLRGALAAFNNAYQIPRIARTVTLIGTAGQASSQIAPVLSTAARASENHDELERERRSRTRLQVVIVVMTYLTLLAVIVVIKTQFLDVITGLGATETGTVGLESSGDTGLETDELSLVLFHAVSIQAVFSGLIAGYVRHGDLRSGLAYVVSLLAIGLCVWAVVG